MTVEMHAAAPHHLPGFITAPGESDALMIGSVVMLVVLVMVLGSLYFWLHSLPERIAHGSGKVQFQLVGVLCLLALFTHNNAFWVAALVLALIPIPDFWTPLANMAESLARMAAPTSRWGAPVATTSEPAATTTDPKTVQHETERNRPSEKVETPPASDKVDIHPGAARDREQLPEGV